MDRDVGEAGVLEESGRLGHGEAVHGVSRRPSLEESQGLPEGLRYPDLTPAMQGCLDSDRPDAVIRAQAAEAAEQGIAATPALQLRDRETGKTLLLHGPVEGDALLSAIDLLAAGNTTVAEPAHPPDMPAGVAGDMPR